MRASMLEAVGDEKMQRATGAAEKNSSRRIAANIVRILNNAKFIRADQESIHKCEGTAIKYQENRIKFKFIMILSYFNHH